MALIPFHSTIEPLPLAKDRELFGWHVFPKKRSRQHSLLSTIWPSSAGRKLEQKAKEEDMFVVKRNKCLLQLCFHHNSILSSLLCQHHAYDAVSQSMGRW